MKKKAKLVLLLCAAGATVIVVLCQPAFSHPVEVAAPDKDAFRYGLPHPPFPAQMGSEPPRRELASLTSMEREALQVIVDGLHSLESEDGGTRAKRARLGHEAMESFLKSWNPIGRKPQVLKALFGKPKEESDDFLLYAFDNGSYAWLYRFVIRDGTVVEITRPLSE